MKQLPYYTINLLRSILNNSTVFLINSLIFIGNTVLAIPLYTISLIIQLLSFCGIFVITLIKIPHYVKKIVTQYISLTFPSFKLFSNFSLKLKFFTLGILLALISATLYQLYTFINDLPDPTLIGMVNYPVSTEIYDRNDRLLYEVYKDQNRTPVKLESLPAFIAEATIAIEDKDFYHHNGISIYGGLIRAFKEMLVNHSFQGGSTITQQLVKTSLLSPERTVERKIKEMILAIWVEQKSSKKQILEMYLNQVPYGGTAYGIEQAAKVYFDKSARDITLAESAFLAGLPQAPSGYSPYSNPGLAKTRRDEVLKKMNEQKYISAEQYTNAIKAELSVVPIRQTIKAPHFIFYVKSLLENYYGVRRVEEGGFRVKTSLDLAIQEKAENILSEEMNKIKELHVTNGAILVTTPKTGEILAMVGSRDYFEEPYGAFNVTTADRQPGSAIKPLMYSLSLDKNYTAATILDDSPIVFKVGANPAYRPVNYDDRYHGKVPIRIALANSYNIPAVKVLASLGVNNFVTHAQNLGITTWNQPERYGLSITLGGADVKMTDMAVAYGVFANGGEKAPLHPILEIKDYRGKTLEDPINAEKKNVIKTGIAYIISSILSDNDARKSAFGEHSQLEILGVKVAVKTGTTNEKHDNWTIGYTPKVLTAVWVGNNDNSPMDKKLTSGVTGAAPIWNRVMSYVVGLTIHSGFPDKLAASVSNEFQIPETVIAMPCYGGRTEYFLRGTEKNVTCQNYFQTPTPTISSQNIPAE